MKKLSLYIFLVLMVCNTAQALPKCKGTDFSKWTNCFGTYTNEEGRKYTGEFGSEPGKRHGQGTLIHPSGVKYVGQFKNDKADGQGTLTFASGDKYVGEWKDNKQHGQGTWTYEDGRVEKGILEKDKLIKFATVSKMMSIERSFDFICYNTCKERNDETFCRQKCSMQ
jgi:hypothetical protein